MFLRSGLIGRLVLANGQPNPLTKGKNTNGHYNETGRNFQARSNPSCRVGKRWEQRTFLLGHHRAALQRRWLEVLQDFQPQRPPLSGKSC